MEEGRKGERKTDFEVEEEFRPDFDVELCHQLIDDSGRESRPCSSLLPTLTPALTNSARFRCASQISFQ